MRGWKGVCFRVSWGLRWSKLLAVTPGVHLVKLCAYKLCTFPYACYISIDILTLEKKTLKGGDEVYMNRVQPFGVTL